MNQFHKVLVVGVGGKKCQCCFPAPRSKARRSMYRKIRRSIKADTRAALMCE